MISVVSEMQKKLTLYILSIGKNKSLAIPNVGNNAEIKKVSLTYDYRKYKLGQPL